MGRLFLSLYLFIVLTLIGLAAVLDHLFLDSDVKEAPWITASASLIRSHLHQPEVMERQLSEAGLAYDWLDRDSVAWPDDLRGQLESGQPLVLHDPDTGQQLVMLAPDHRVLLIHHPQGRGPVNFWLYSGLFFGALAVLLSLWIWPLWRDLSKLRDAAHSLRQDGSLPELSVSTTSALSGILQSFNQLGSQIKQLLQSQRELTGAVAHEFRTPLSRLKFALAVEPKPGTEPWQEMSRDVDELERLVQEMLDYTSMESSAPEMDFAQLPMAELVDNLVTRMRGNCPAHVRVETSLADIYMLGDGHFVQRSLQNVLQNAMRYARSLIRISIERVDDNILLRVDDDGPGVAEADRERIFEPFFRPDASRDRKRGGAGLGLAIVRRIQQWHRGSCSVERSPMGGARFILSYPVQ
ncbi:ATP-binding protein [Bowmanella dokdonensis]|uniref:histidine kinase n=1 Tax=Bowmanella dokdonensis TaxID=751969 RepID=A0A939IS65_9ALTE|nr:ATP-binding protein [Bowmanella dokdonensis]MBN7826111.1 two-component sensor histidine kinase [Bowmanella dokdonensis]